jgi:transcriptional regulator with XRE-family HTH domain
MADEPEELRVLTGWLRMVRNCPQKEMALAAGIDPDLLARYESGLLAPPRADVERLAAAARVPIHLVDSVLLPAIRALCQARARRDLSAGDLWEVRIDAIFDEAVESLMASSRVLFTEAMIEFREWLNADEAGREEHSRRTERAMIERLRAASALATAQEAMPGGPRGARRAAPGRKPAKKPPG